MLVDGGSADAAEGSAQRDQPAEEGLDRIWTIPNLISVGRLGLIGIFLWLLFGEHERVAATIVLAVAGATDFVDGYVARRFHQVSTLGKVLDPTADRIVVGTGVIAIAVYGAVPPWLAGVVLGRELLVSLAVLVLAMLRARRIDVLWVGKAGTFGLLVCFPLLLLTFSGETWAHVLRDITWVAFVPAFGLSCWAAASYVPLARKALAERRLPRAEPLATGAEGVATS